MPKKPSEEEFDRIVHVLAPHRDGLSISSIEAALGNAFPRRTLNRRLGGMIAAKRVTRRGVGKSSVYRVQTNLVDTQGAAFDQFSTPDGAVSIPLSPAARTQLQYVSRPIAMRTPVGYARKLLDDYLPNRTHYLPLKLTAQLKAMGQPIAAKRAGGTFARDILSRLLIDLSWASSRLEGNTYTRLDTQRLIDYGQAAEGKDAKETQMILNHKAAIELVVEGGEDVGVNTYTILNLHALLSDNLMADPEALGRLRRRPVEVGKSVYTPLAVPQLIEECFTSILKKAAAIHDPFEQAFFLMVHIPYLQPFEDVNKRVSRLAANLPLIKANLCPLSFVDVPESAYVAGTLAIYEMSRVDLLCDVFEWAYTRSCQQYVVVRDSLAEPDAFRTKHKANLTTVIGTIIRDRVKPTNALIRREASRLVGAKELEQFARVAMQEFARLYEGNIARFRVKLSDYRSWRGRLQKT
jgi:hypothetical protein